MYDAAAVLARSTRVAMMAPAGSGKTQVIATAVACHGGRRELVLTHTHAGVDALRRRLITLGADASRYHIDTIAGWSLRLASSFPRTADLPSYEPRSSEEYSAVYDGAARLVRMSPIQEILRASYSGVYVDEYQDCTLEQHNVVTALTEVLPCRIVGDPLQAIFGFGDNQLVDWGTHVADAFAEVPGSTKPWRWMKSNPELGDWLQEVREKLETGQEIGLLEAPIQWVDCSNDRQQIERTVCMNAARNDGETVVAIREWPRQCHDLARRLLGRFSCVEPIDTTDLYDSAVQIGSTAGMERAVHVIDFATKCMTQVSSKLRTIRAGLAGDRIPNVSTNREQLAALLLVVEEDGIVAIEEALDVIARIPGAIIYRRELLWEMKRAIRVVVGGEVSSLEEAAWIVRNRTRRLGRFLPRCALGTTLLVKGLEFDHAVVLDAESYNVENLYVAMTRGSRSLTIVSNAPCLRPRPASETIGS